MHDRDQYITLTDAAKLTPGRPSTNCIWRWCRRGVLTRGGERCRLKHVRVGGKIFTTPAWIDEFAKALAEADTTYFDAQADRHAASQRNPRRGRAPLRAVQAPKDTHLHADRELEAAGF